MRLLLTLNIVNNVYYTLPNVKASKTLTKLLKEESFS